MKKNLFIIWLILVSSLVFAQTEKVVVRRSSGGAFKPVRVQYYDPTTAQWLRKSEWNAVYGMNDLQNYYIIPMGKEFNGVRRKISIDKNFAIAGGAMILTSVAGYIAAGAMSGYDGMWNFKERYKSLNLAVILDAMVGIGALTILLGIHVSYEGVPVGNHAFIDTSGTGIKFTKKF